MEVGGDNMGFKMKGSDELINELNKLGNKAEELHGKRSVAFNELYNDSFMKEYTKHNSIVEFFEASPFEFENEDDFVKIDTKELDKWITANTSFETWEDMKGKAATEYYARQLGF